MENIERIKQTSNIIERNLLFGLCADYGNYNKIKRFISHKDFHTLEFKEIFNAIKSLYDNSGFKNIDKFTVESYCIDKHMSTDSMNRLKMFVENGKNIDVDFDGVYNQFRRTNGLLSLHLIAEKQGGFEQMFVNMYDNSNTADEMRGQINDLAKKTLKTYKSAIKITDLSAGMVEFVKERMFIKDGRSIDFINKPYLQNYSQGISVGVTFFTGHSGKGKTSITIPFFSIPILESGQKLLSIHNEQEEDEIRNLYLMAYISQVKKNKLKLHRDNFNFNNKDKISQEQMDFLLESAKELEERYADKLMFAFFPRFNPDDLENIIVEYERNGYKNVLLDTFKQEDSADGWEGLDTLAKKMDGISKEYGMKIVCTAQLSQHTGWRKYLTASCIGKAKSIKEVATSMYMFRWLEFNEIPTIKYSYYAKDEKSGKIIWKNNMELDQFWTDKSGNKHIKTYIALFNDKQRKAKDGQVIIYEADLGGLYFKEVGVTTSIKNDDTGR